MNFLERELENLISKYEDDGNYAQDDSDYLQNILSELKNVLREYRTLPQYSYPILFDCAEGTTQGKIKLTEEEAEIVAYALNWMNWDDADCDAYGPDAKIDLYEKEEV